MFTEEEKKQLYKIYLDAEKSFEFVEAFSASKFSIESCMYFSLSIDRLNYRVKELLFAFSKERLLTKFEKEIFRPKYFSSEIELEKEKKYLLSKEKL